MPIADQKLTLEGNAKVLECLSEEFYELIRINAEYVSNKRIYSIKSEDEPAVVRRAARQSFFTKLSEKKEPLKKVAFDTRRIDQQNVRNSRENLQFWHRSDPFVDDELEKRANNFKKINKILDEIEEEYGGEPYYLKSYVKELNSHVKRGLKDGEYFLPHFDNLEQLLFTRYRLSKDDLEERDESFLKSALLSKDEVLTKISTPMPKMVKNNNSNDINTKISTLIRDVEEIKKQNSNSGNGGIVINNSPASSQDNIINALLGNSQMVKSSDGRVVERTITITIRDEVKD